jgi:GTPase KRas
MSVRSVLTTEGQLLAQEMGCRFIETSAKLGTNVTETFIDLVCDIRDRNRVGCSELVFCHS